MTRESPSGTGRLLAYWGLAVAAQSLVVVLSIGTGSSLGFPFRMPMNRDLEIFHESVKPILEGRLPYREYGVEYPIGAIVVFLVPLVGGSSFAAYRIGFTIEMMLLNAATVWLVARQVAKTEGVERVPDRLTWYTLYFAALCPLLVIRFDVVPMTLAFAAVYGTTRGRMALGGVLAGIGILVKLVPGLVLLPLLAQAGPWRAKEKALMGLVVIVGLGVLPWWIIGGDKIIDTLTYHTQRGIEIGSLYASAYMVAHRLAGIWIITSYGHGSMEIGANGARDAARLSTILLGAILVLVASRARNSGPGQEFRFAAAALLAYITFGKVLSPQYLIWLIPFVCVLGGPAGSLARPLFLAIALLTTALYPHLFQELCLFESWPVAILVIRNLGLIGLLAILLGRRTLTPTQSSPAACS